MKVAITTSNGKDIDMHFNKAEQFYIYELMNGDLRFIEKRMSMKYGFDRDHNAINEDRLNKVCEVINDCRFLYTAQIGDATSRILRRKGIYAEIVECTIESLM